MLYVQEWPDLSIYIKWLSELCSQNMQIFLKLWRNGKAQQGHWSKQGLIDVSDFQTWISGSLDLFRMSLIYSFHRGGERGPGEIGLINLKYLCNLRIVGLEQFLY